MSPLPARKRIRPIVAFRALRALAESGGRDLRQGVAFLRATEGRSLDRAFRRFQRSNDGTEILERDVSLIDQLRDCSALSALPEESLGRAYLELTKRHGLSLPDLMDLAGSIEASPAARRERIFLQRTHAMHDLWHVVTGYGPEELGEVCILAFRSAQMRHVGVWIMCLGGMVKVGRDLGSARVRAAVLEAYRRGRTSVWLYGVDWEAMLPRPLILVRRRLNLSPPAHYPL